MSPSHSPSDNSDHLQQVMDPISVPVSDIPKKKTKGRQRITMQRIVDRCKRHVAFSKRRTSLFKKASELSSLCGSEVAVIAFSEAGKAFTFGHPSVDSVIQRYLLIWLHRATLPLAA